MTDARYHVLFVAPDVDSNTTTVRRLDMEEGLSISYRIEVDVELQGDDPLEPEPLLMSDVGVMVLQGGEVLRRWSGIAMRVRERATPGARRHIGVTIESPLAPLRLERDHRIYQEKTTQDIVDEILGPSGITPDWRLSGSYAAREVCTQYDETTFDFLHRILEEDGIFYFFEFGEDGPKLVFGDDTAAYSDLTPKEISFVEDTGLSSGQAIQSVVETERVRPAKVTLRDHDFTRPALDLEVVAEAETALGLEHYDYPGRYFEAEIGQKRAETRRDGFLAQATGARAESTTFSLTAGHRFSLVDAPDDSLDGEWVVRDARHRYRAPSDGESHYDNDLSLLRTEVTYRPAPALREAVVAGPQVATVTGPAGEEIHCDEHGRIKVHFPWDRKGTTDEKSSGWVRVTQMHSSGSIVIPRIGWEVLVDFENGDPDRPVALGRLYNGVYGPPVPLPDNKTQSLLKSASSPGSAGFNEIRMEDGGGGELFSVQAQKDQNVVVANNKTEKVATNASHGVGSNHTLTVGANRTTDVGADDALNVGSDQTWTVGGSRTKTISGSELIDIKGSRTITIGGSHTTMTPLSFSVKTPASLSETVGGSCLEVAALEVGSAVAGAASVTVGGAKIEACASGKGDTTIGARASTIGGALVQAGGGDVGMTVGGAKATTVGGVFAANAGGDFELSSGSSLNINVGGAVSMNGASVVMKVGGSSVTLAGGQVTLSSSTIKLTATGPHPEFAPAVADK